VSDVGGYDWRGGIPRGGGGVNRGIRFGVSI
jgi:hypothetical protein